jgi:hypothetical protein
MPVYTSTLQYRELLWEGLFLHVVVLALAKKSAVFEYKRWAVDLVPEKYTVPRGIIRRYGTRRQVQFNEVLSAQGSKSVKERIKRVWRARIRSIRILVLTVSVL